MTTTTTTTATATATAALLVAMVPAGASAASITDLAVSGEVTALADGQIDLFDSSEGPGFSESNDQQATSFGEFPLSVSAIADAETSGGLLPFRFADAFADLNVERTPTGVEGSLELDTGGFFTQTNSRPFNSGAGFSTATFSYSFLVDAQTAFELTARTNSGLEALTNQRVELSSRLIDDLTGNTLADLDDDFNFIRSVDTTSGLLEPGTYTLLVDASAEAFESLLFQDFAFSLNFSEVEAPNPVPSPAALPAGLALLCGLIARRKR